ncbi:MAG: BON domain-containing protein [Dehalococcoidia bacterium]
MTQQGRSSVVTRIEQWLDDAGLALAVEEDADGRIVISGLVGTDEEREAAREIAREIAGERAIIDDDITVTGAVPANSYSGSLSETEVGGFEGATPGLEEHESLNPGDFGDQRTVPDAQAAQPGALSDMPSDTPDLVREGDHAYVPPIDPGDRADPMGRPEGSTSGEPEQDAVGDEALREAVVRALAEDAATANLQIDVAVLGCVARLTGVVPDLVDAEQAEAVAARVPGIVAVIEETQVEGLDRRTA